jgi:hypothetical protein
VQGAASSISCSSDATCAPGVCRGHLDCSGLYFGGGQPSGINLPGVVPDNGLNFSKIASCSGDNLNLVATTAAEVPGPGCSTPAGTPTYGTRHCTGPGCLFGAPLALPNPLATSTGTCVINAIDNVAGAGNGTATCSNGAMTNLNLPLASQVFLTGAIEAVRVCSTCVGGTTGVCGSGTCMGGSRNGLACTPETSALTGSYPTSHDCPPPGYTGTVPATCGSLSGTFLGCLPITFNLTTGTQTKTAFAAGPQTRVFCGFCADTTGGNPVFNNPPQACSADATCPGTHTGCATLSGDSGCCAQHSNGAFRNAFATTITETGTPAGVSLSDGLPHNSTLVSVFCIPPSYNAIVDPSGELPGPGAVSLPGQSQLIP